MTELLVVHRVLLVAVAAVLAHLAVVRPARVVRQALGSRLRFDWHDEDPGQKLQEQKFQNVEAQKNP